MSDRMSAYRLMVQTEAYEVGVLHGQIVAACRCGAGQSWPDKGLGRAFSAAWQTQHQGCAPVLA